VEDDANNLDVASRIIRASGHEALVAADGVAGLDLARVERPDAILVDLLLPRMDGWSLTRSLRTEPWAASIPIIAVSALALPSDRARAIEAGGDDYLTKPFEPVELAARVRSAIFTKRLQDELRKTAGDLKRMEQSRKELIGMLGHDIRNLANSVVAFMQLVRMGQLKPGRSEFDELLRLSESNISELLRMVNALLDVYK